MEQSNNSTISASYPLFRPPDPPYDPSLPIIVDPFETMLAVMAQRQYENTVSQTPFFNSYYVLKLTYGRQKEGISDTAILLLPWSEVSTWSHYSMYVFDHSGPLQSKVDRYTINGKHMEWRIAPMIDNTENIEYLMSTPGERSVMPAENIIAFDRIIRNTRPLFDEYAMLYTAVPRAKSSLMDAKNFGTYANQVRDAIERKGGLKGLHWRGREVEQDPNVSDTALEFTRKEKKCARTNQG